MVLQELAVHQEFQEQTVQVVLQVHQEFQEQMVLAVHQVQVD